MRIFDQLSVYALQQLSLIADFCVRWSWLVVALALLVAGTSAAYTARNFTVNTSTKGMIDSRLDFRRNFDELAAAFPQFENAFVVVVDADTPETAEQAARQYAGVLNKRPGLFKNIYAPATENFFENNGLLYLSTDEVEAAMERLGKTAPLLNGLSRDATLRGLARFFTGGQLPTGNPETLSRFVPFLNALAEVVEQRAAGTEAYLPWLNLLEPETGRQLTDRQLVFLNPVLDFSRLEPAQTSLDAAKEIGASLAASIGEGTRFRITGEAALRTEELESVTEGATIAGMLSFIFASLIIIVGLRSLRLVAASIVSLLTGLFLTAAFATVAIGYLNIISIAFAVLFIGLGIDFAIHFALRYQEEANKGIGNRLAMYNTVQGVGVPLSVCTGTTALAFFAFTPTAFVGMSQLGIIAGTGMLISFATTFTIMPAMLSITANRNSRSPSRLGWSVPPAWRHVASMLVVAAGIASLFFVSDVEFDGDPINLRDPATESVQAFQELIANGDNTPYAAQVLVDEKADIEDIKARMADVAVAGDIVSVFAFVPDAQERKREIISRAAGQIPSEVSTGQALDNAARMRAVAQLSRGLGGLAEADVPEDVASAANRTEAAFNQFASVNENSPDAYAMLEAGIFERFSPALEQINASLDVGPIAVGDLPADLRDRYVTAEGRYRVEIYPTEPLSGEAEMRQFVEIMDRNLQGATGNASQIIKSADVVSRAMLIATALAGGLITFILIFGLRRLTNVLLVLFPVALAGALTLGAMVALDIQFNFANVIVLPLLIGLGVDSGIHLVTRARDDGGQTKLFATSTPRAVLLSALTTIGSFGSLSLSSHMGLSSMGLLLMISVVMTLLCSLVVLPSVLDYAHRKA